MLFAATSARQLTDACGADPSWLCRTTLDATGSETAARIVDAVLGKPLAIAAIVIGALIINRIARRAIKRTLRTLNSGAVKERLGAVRRATPDALLETRETSLRAEQRIEALSSVLSSVASFVILIVAGLMVLGELGINLAPLLAGAGIVGIALGFGSQTLVKDFLSGIFILVEDQFGVGDIVDLDQTTTGTIEAVSLRTTRLRSVDGTVWHVPNGDIRRVGNQSQHWSRALLDIEVAYGTEIDHAKAVINRVAAELDRDEKDILEPPDLWGVEQLGASGVILRLVIKTTPSAQWRISRALRERIKNAFDAEGIEIPFPQQTVWFRPDAGGHREPAQSNGN